jgi:hypothetical protein
MRFKSSLSAILSAVAVGSVLCVTALPGAACPFADQGSPDSLTSTAPSNPTSTSLNLNQSNPSQLATGSLVALLGLALGGLFLKAKLAKRQEDDFAEVPQTESATSSETYEHKEYPSFPIVVPAEALETEAVDTKDADEAAVR